jgi:branched-chain amino acid transport system permease protein
MGEPYTVTALIVITLGGFGSMGGALAGGLALGVSRRWACTSPTRR